MRRPPKYEIVLYSPEMDNSSRTVLIALANAYIFLLSFNVNLNYIRRWIEFHRNTWLRHHQRMRCKENRKI